MSALCQKDAAVARHHSPDELTECLLIPAPDRVGQALDLGLLTPEPEFLQPLNKGIRPARR